MSSDIRSREVKREIDEAKKLSKELLHVVDEWLDYARNSLKVSRGVALRIAINGAYGLMLNLIKNLSKRENRVYCLEVYAKALQDKETIAIVGSAEF